MKPFLSILAVVMTLFFCGAVSAQSPDEEVEDEAVTHFEKGAELYFEEEYEAAIVEFMKGHRISPNAMFLYNVSLSHVKIGNLDDALEAARAARGLPGLDPTTRIQNEGRIAALELLENTRESIEERQIAEADTSADEVEEVVMISQVEPTKSNFGALGWTGLGFTLAGFGLLTSAMVVEITLQDTWSEYEAVAQFGDESEYLALRSDIKKRQRVGLILLASGTGAAAVGLTLLSMQLFSDSETRSTFYVEPRGDAAVIGAGGVF